MAVFKCKMCGGTLEIQGNESVAVCEYCGMKQTLPRLEDERRANLYDRANHFRQNDEFDKAMNIYDQILNEDPEDAEAYWSLVLCRYGIEYVEDPGTHKRIPTVNRAQFTSVLADEDYKLALQYADSIQREIYEAEAKTIDEIQKGILEISSKEEPFDIFICYKETDHNGRRTHDSVLANDLYHELTEEGYKVFFSRITLEDKIGSAYEPYIFAALNSAKVMVVIGTRPEYFNSPWVKNEWSRYLALIKNGAKKMLIPAYKDMDPYDMPEEFSHLQAQDMGKLGFMQDLVRGIKKIAAAEEPKAADESASTGNTNTAPLLKRAFMFLEDGEWASATEYCERVLDQDPENAKAYLGKLMAELRVNLRDNLADCSEPFDERNNYKKALRFADDELTASLKGYISQINDRNELERIKRDYDRALEIMKYARNELEFKNAAELFHSTAGYENSSTWEANCLEKAEQCRKEEIYSAANKIVWKTDAEIDTLEEAIRLFESISDWNDSAERIEHCRRKIEEIKLQEERERSERERREEKERIAAKRRKMIIAVIFVLIIGICAVKIKREKEIAREKEEIALRQEEEKKAALRQKLDQAEMLVSEGKYEEAREYLEEINDESAIKEDRYNKAMEYMSEEDYGSAYLFLTGLNYEDSEAKKDEIKELAHQVFFERAEKGSIIYFGEYEQDNDTSNGKETIEWIVLKKKKQKMLVISRYALDYTIFDFDQEGWKDSYIRQQLNEDFISSAFSGKEQERIRVTHLSGECPHHDEPTEDRIFLLSVDEVEKYKSDGFDLQCIATACASDGLSVDRAGRCIWWLRTCGSGSNSGEYSLKYAAAINQRGYVDEFGENKSSYDFNGMRPAMWINLE